MDLLNQKIQKPLKNGMKLINVKKFILNCINEYNSYSSKILLHSLIECVKFILQLQLKPYLK